MNHKKIVKHIAKELKTYAVQNEKDGFIIGVSGGHHHNHRDTCLISSFPV